MRRTLWKAGSTVVLTGWLLAIGTLPAQAQSVNASRSLGGYGATSTSPMAAMGATSPMIPYAGSFSGFMPYRMASGAGSGLSFSTRGSSVIQSSRSSFSLAPMSGGMGSSTGARSGSLEPFRSQSAMGVGAARMMNQPSGAGNTNSVVPPNFGYPFYQPPSLLSPAGAGAGMSM
jgi:hypothetical protein